MPPEVIAAFSAARPRASSIASGWRVAGQARMSRSLRSMAGGVRLSPAIGSEGPLEYAPSQQAPAAGKPMASTQDVRNDRPLVGIVMGSRSDWETMQHAAQKL